MASPTTEGDVSDPECIEEEEILAGGFECEFVKKPPSVLQTECPVCLLILHEPYQVTCCGKSYCQVCIGRIKSEHKPCPTCNNKNIQYFPNKGLQQPLYQFKVRCTHQKEGCKWTGELGELDNHLNINPQPEKRLKGCDFTTIECRYSFAGCEAMLPRKDMQEHIQESTKQHFAFLEAKYNTVCGEHFAFKQVVSEKFPMPSTSFTMDKYEYRSQEKEGWLSPPFYTGLRGYKMCLRVQVGLRTPLSVQLRIMRGEFDDNLNWEKQFNQEIGVEVVSQVSWEPNRSVAIYHAVPSDTPHYSRYYHNVQQVTCGSTVDDSFGTEESKSLIQPLDMYMFVKNDSVEFRIMYARDRKITPKKK